MTSTRPPLAGLPGLTTRTANWCSSSTPLSLRCRVPSIWAPGLDFHLLSVGHAKRTPGRNPGLSSFRRAAWARSLPPPHAPVNFLAARAAPGRHDVRVINLRIREAINMGACAVRVLKRSGATHAEDAARLSHVHGEAACAVWDSLETWSGPCSEQAPRRVDRPDAIGESPEVADTHGSWGKSCSRTCARTLRHRGSCHAGDHSRCPGTQT